MTSIPLLPTKLLPLSRLRPPRSDVSASLMEKLASYAQTKFDELICSDTLFREYIGTMKRRKIKGVVFGGWARDRIHEVLNSVGHISNDIDIVAAGNSSIVEVLGVHATPTVFGGAGVRASTVYFDAWDLPNTFHIKKYSLDACFETLPLTADYTFNSVIFKPSQFFKRPEIYEVGAVYAIKNRIVEFQADEVILPIVQASRALNLAAKLNFEISPTVKQFLREVCEEENVLAEVWVGLERYCPIDVVGDAKKKLIEALS